MNPPAKKDPIKVVRVNGESGQSEDAVTATWTGYLNGHWTRTPPVRTGRYLVADKSGIIAGYVAVYTDPATGKIQITKKWEGWWWSFPLPPTPVSPPKIWEEDGPALRLVKND